MESVRLAETVVDAVDGPVVAVEIADAAGAVEGPAAVDGIAVGAADRAGEGTRNLPRIYTDDQRPRRESWPFLAGGCRRSSQAVPRFNRVQILMLHVRRRPPQSLCPIELHSSFVGSRARLERLRFLRMTAVSTREVPQPVG